MSKLYPPYIEGTIPAFCENKQGTVIMTVPFSMNRAVNKKQVSGFCLKLKTIQSDRYLITARSDVQSNNVNIHYDLTKQEVYFDLTNLKNELNIGQFYKVQIAYIDRTGEIGYYSSVGIIKYTSMPQVYINGLESNTINLNTHNFLGCYSQEVILDEKKDYSEKEYSYRFVIYNNNNEIIEDTGYLIHNNSRDINSYESNDDFFFSSDLELNKKYYIQYSVITNNNLEVSSPKYKIIQRKSIEPNIKTKPLLELNYENGYVDIKLDSSSMIEGYNNEKPVSGTFILSRTTDLINWEQIFKFALINDKLSLWHWRDFTVEQGKIYTYSIQEYNDYGLYSERILSDSILVDFEDSFLFDGVRQLKIKYNPKISSFKTDLLESKMETIGSKYPFIFKNGQVEYKEFPISGLISYQMDEDNLFMKDEDLGLTKNFARKKTAAAADTNLNVRTTNLVGYNFSAEREFKLEVLDWLNNGIPKLFRSPGEGNYIVRLMNSSLSPEDGLGRLLHTFSSTAYEVADCNYDNLNKYGFISIENPDLQQTRWTTILLKDKYDAEATGLIELLGGVTASSIQCLDMMPGDIIYINGRSIAIGATGSFFLENEDIQSIQIIAGRPYIGQITYSYEDTTSNTFDEIIEIKNKDVVADQFIGYYENIVKELEDIKTIVSNFYYLKFYKRTIIEAYPKVIDSIDYDEYGNISNIYKNYEKDEDGFIKLYRDQNYTSNIKDIPESSNLTDAFEDPFILYKYKVDYIDLSYIDNRSVPSKWVTFRSYGYDRVELDKEDFILSDEDLQDRYFTRDRFGEYHPANTYKKGEEYYMKKPYEFYYDPQNIYDKISSQETENRIKEYISIQKQNGKINTGTVNGVLQMEELTPRIEFSTKCYIDENEIDLEEIEKYEIETLYKFNNISLSCGTYLNCGYELQILEYNEENDIKNYQLLKNLRSILNSTYNDIKTADFQRLLKTSAIQSSTYSDIINEAQEMYNGLYKIYIEELEKILKEKEG